MVKFQKIKFLKIFGYNQLPVMLAEPVPVKIDRRTSQQRQIRR